MFLDFVFGGKTEKFLKCNLDRNEYSDTEMLLELCRKAEIATLNLIIIM